jgi:hypothetical protein
MMSKPAGRGGWLARSRIPGNVGQGDGEQRLGQEFVSDFSPKPGVGRDPAQQPDFDRSVAADLMHGRGRNR